MTDNRVSDKMIDNRVLDRMTYHRVSDRMTDDRVSVYYAPGASADPPTTSL